MVFFLFWHKGQGNNFISFGVILKGVDSFEGATEGSVEILSVDDEDKRVDIFEGEEAELFFSEGVDEVLEELFFSFLNFVDFLVVATEIIQTVVKGREVRTVFEILSG